MEENDKEDELPEQEVEATTPERKPLVYNEIWIYLLAIGAFIAVIIYLFYFR